MRPILTVLFLTLAASSAIAGPCAVPQTFITTFTPAGATLDQTGGVVVGLVAGFSDGAPLADIAKLDWQVSEPGAATSAHKRTPPKLTVLAPGLAVLSGPKQELVVEDAAHKPMLHVKFASTPVRDQPIAAAPSVRSITWTHVQGPRSTSDATTVVLAAAPAGRTIAVLVYDPAELKAGKPARSFAVVPPKAMSFEIFRSGRCVGQVAGARPSLADDKVVLVWVDEIGHTSLPSPEIVVKR